MEKSIDEENGKIFHSSDKNINADDNNSSKASSHIKNIELYDKMNFQRIQVKRSSVKFKTTVAKPKLTIEKFTDEITKIVEEVNLNGTVDEKKKKRTIKFATQKVTFQYAKEKEEIKSLFSDSNSTSIFTDINPIDEDEKEAIFVFGKDEEEGHDVDEDHLKEKDDKHHINLNNYEENTNN